MNILLDTHAFLWFIEGSSQLSQEARALIESLDNHRFLSVASLWEMSIKSSIGKLDLSLSFVVLVQREVYGNNINLLAIQPVHLDVLAKLPFHHKDPFDRLIIAQSLTAKIPILTKGHVFDRYGVTRVW
ncbi:MAG: type II toxin-antitoxin system VapC family toxin [Cyanobacteria bacterium P01_H01_bin.153]